MCFLSLRQRVDTVQALVSVAEGKVSKQMVRWVASLQDESIVLVEGTVTVPPEVIKSATVGNVEIHVNRVRVELFIFKCSSLILPIFVDPLDFGTRGATAILARGCFTRRDRVGKR